MASQNIVIDVPDDDLVIVDSNEAPQRKPTQDDGIQRTDPAVASLKDQISKLSKERQEQEERIRSEAAARTAAEHEARRHAQEAARSKQDAAAARIEGVDAQRVAIDNAIAATTSALDSAESDFVSASEAGDFKKAGAAQRRMAEAAAQLATLESGKSAMPSADQVRASATKEGRVDPDPEPPRQPSKDAQFERYLNQFTPTTQRWLRDHPECVTDQTKNAAVIRAHHVAVDKGLKEESPEYFAFVERKLGYRKDEDDDDDEDGQEPVDGGRREPVREDRQVTARSNAAAPVSRNGGDGRGTRVSLTPGEASNATDGTIVWNLGQHDGRGKRITADDDRLGKPIGLEEAARRKRAFQREGRYDNPNA